MTEWAHLRDRRTHLLGAIVKVTAAALAALPVRSLLKIAKVAVVASALVMFAIIAFRSPTYAPGI